MRRLGTVGAACVVALALAAPDAGAITVDSNTDSVDGSPANGICESPCSLRAAIQTANQDAGNTPSAITFDLSLVTLNSLSIGGANEDASATGDLDVTEDLTITGNGAASTIVDGGDLDRVLDVRAGTVSISGVTIRNGSAPLSTTPPNFGEGGGGVRTGGSAVVTINDSLITDNEVAERGHGGGLAAEGTSALTLNRTTVSSNRAIAGVNGGGGGGVTEEAPGVVVKIVDSTITGNRAQYAAGVWDDATGTVEITRSTVSNNATVAYDPSSPIQIEQGGGVVEDAGTVTITDSVISGNTATYGAGAVEGGGTLTITNSTFSGNHAKAVTTTQVVNQFPFSNGAGAGVLQFSNGNLNVAGSTFTGNTADLNGGAFMIQGGGGGPTATLTNSTLTGNSAGTGGGGIRSERRALSVVNSTIDGNTAALGANVNLCSGGPQVNPTFCQGSVTLRNSIVSGGSSANCAVAQGTLSSGGHNLDSGTSCGFSGPGDKTNASPQLGPLAANGGPTQTKALQDGSPAIDSADNCPATDQRGVGRPFGPVCDIGAFEGGSPLVAAPPGNNNNINKPPAEKPAPDLAVAGRAACLSIPGVVRDQKANAPGGGRLVLQTRQVDDPGHPLRTAVKGTGGARVKSVTIKVNGRASAGSVAQNLLRLGSKAKRNKVTATVTLRNGKKVTLTQFMIVLKCSTPATRCTRLADGKSMRCTSKTPLGGRRVRITASRTTTEVAKGSGTVSKGKYTAVLRSAVPLAAGTYAYKHVVTTSKPRQRYFMIRRVTVT
jgi:CSLREA domain-containing protein